MLSRPLPFCVICFPLIVFCRIDRVACEDVTIKGVSIPKGTHIQGLVYAIHHDPEYWPLPETFDPLR